MEDIQFNKGVVKPMECFREGWELIKDRYWLFFCNNCGGVYYRQHSSFLHSFRSDDVRNLRSAF